MTSKKKKKKTNSKKGEVVKISVIAPLASQLVLPPVAGREL